MQWDLILETGFSAEMFLIRRMLDKICGNKNHLIQSLPASWITQQSFLLSNSLLLGSPRFITWFFVEFSFLNFSDDSFLATDLFESTESSIKRFIFWDNYFYISYICHLFISPPLISTDGLFRSDSSDGPTSRGGIIENRLKNCQPNWRDKANWIDRNAQLVYNAPEYDKCICLHEGVFCLYFH